MAPRRRIAIGELDGGHVGHRDRLLELDEHVDHAVLQHLELADRLAKLLALLGVVQRAFVQAAQHAASLAADRDRRLVDHGFHQRQPRPLGADQRLRREGDVFEQHLGGARTVHRRIVAGGDARRRLIDQEHRHAAGLALGAAGAGGDDQLVGPRRADHNGFVAVQHPARAVLARGGGEVGPVVAALRLGGGEGEDRLAGDDPGQQVGLGRMVGTGEEAAADHHRAHVGLDHQRRAQLLHDHHGLGRAAAQAAQVFRQGRAQNAEIFGERLPDFRPPPGLRLQRRAAGLEGVVVGEIGREAVAQQGLFFGEAEVHELAFGSDGPG